jgi:hypothetical protein
MIWKSETNTVKKIYIKNNMNILYQEEMNILNKIKGLEAISLTCVGSVF